MKAFSMNNDAPPVGTELTAFVATSSAHRAIHLRHSEWRSCYKNWLGCIAM